MKSLQYILLLSGATLFWQCEPTVDEFQPSAGQADFTKFVSIGDSYSAGYTDGALGYEGQLVSFPNIIAEQLKSVGMQGEFKQPLTAEGKSVGTTTIDVNGNKNGYFSLQIVNGALKPIPSIGDMTIFSTLIGSDGPFNNVAVPGAKSYHLLVPGFGNPAAGVGNYNPFYTRFASNPTSSSVIGDALLNNGTFFSLWIGGNDVLGYALEGGEKDAITNPAYFEGYISTIITSLTQNGAKGVIANIPDINAIPYFNYVQYNSLPLDASKAAQLNAGYAQYNVVAKAYGLDTIGFNAGNNAFIIEDQDITLPSPLKFRQIKNGEKLLLNLPADSISNPNVGWGTKKPIPAKYVLDATEVKAIADAVVSYNTSIKSLAELKGLAFVDLNSLMNEIVTGKIIDGATYSSTFVSGNIFSLDGIHSTPRGSAVIANEFIKAINSKYGASVPQVNVNNYRTNLFP